MMSERDVIFYDGACGMCRRSTRWLSRLDWLGRLDIRDLTRVAPEELPVDQDAAMRGMPMRTRGGRVHVGFPAVRRALAQTPLGLLPALILYLPGVSRAGRAVYDRIAANRSREACEICETGE
jgi:predicted DCC family thiol-disulfide oxidoreductase YuxK